MLSYLGRQRSPALVPELLANNASQLDELLRVVYRQELWPGHRREASDRLSEARIPKAARVLGTQLSGLDELEHQILQRRASAGVPVDFGHF